MSLEELKNQASAKSARFFSGCALLRKEKFQEKLAERGSFVHFATFPALFS